MVQAPPGQQRPSADRVFRGLRIASGVEGKGQPSVLWTGSSPATPQRAQPGGSSRRAGPRRFQLQSCRKVSSGLRIKETGSAGLTACFEQQLDTGLSWVLRTLPALRGWQIAGGLHSAGSSRLVPLNLTLPHWPYPDSLCSHLGSTKWGGRGTAIMFSPGLITEQKSWS